MTVHIDWAVRENCWNLYDSYGQICVGCGCCSSDPKVRAESRLRVCKRMLQEQYDFDDWDEDEGWKETQQKNIRLNIQYFKRRVRYYEKRLKELKRGG